MHGRDRETCRAGKFGRLRHLSQSMPESFSEQSSLESLGYSEAFIVMHRDCLTFGEENLRLLQNDTRQ